MSSKCLIRSDTEKNDGTHPNSGTLINLAFIIISTAQSFDARASPAARDEVSIGLMPRRRFDAVPKYEGKEHRALFLPLHDGEGRGGGSP